MQPTLQTFIGVFVNDLGIEYSMNVWSGIKDPGARFSKVPIINGPGKPLPFTLKVEVSIVLHLP